MKVIISENSRIWDSSHPALEEFGSDVVRFRHQTPEELLEAAGDDRDILVLTDNDPASFIAFRILTAGFRSRRIHLFSCLPFSYESVRRRREIVEQLSDLSMVKSLCLVELDSYVRNADPEEKLDQLQARIRGQAMLLLARAVPEIRTGTDEFFQYFYSEEKGSYERTDLGILQERLRAMLIPDGREPAADTAVPENTDTEKTAPEKTGPEESSAGAPDPETNAAEEITAVRTETERKEKTGKKRRTLLDLFRKKEDRLR